MAGQRYNTVQGRLENFSGRVLARAQLNEMLCKVGDMHQMPKNKSQKITFLRFLPYGGVDNQFLEAGKDAEYIAQHLTADGVTPSADSVSYVTQSAILQNIGCVFSYSNEVFETHEEGMHMLDEMEVQVGDRLTLCREMMCYGELKSASNQFFGGAGTTIATVNGPPTRTMSQRSEKTIKRLYGKPINRMLKSGVNYGSQAVPASFPAYHHTDLRQTLENTPGFKKVEDYGGRPLLDEEHEVGTLGSLRFIENPNFTYMPDAGAAVGTWTGAGTPMSTGGTNIDVYPVIVMGQGNSGGGAFGQVALRGHEAIKTKIVPLNQVDSGDPLGQKGSIGGITWQAQLIENDAWLTVWFVGAED